MMIICHQSSSKFLRKKLIAKRCTKSLTHSHGFSWRKKVIDYTKQLCYSIVLYIFISILFLFYREWEWQAKIPRHFTSHFSNVKAQAHTCAQHQIQKVKHVVHHCILKYNVSIYFFLFHFFLTPLCAESFLVFNISDVRRCLNEMKKALL